VLLRSAEGTGVDGVIIPKHRSVGITPAVAKTSSGASEHLMIADVANLRQAIDALKEKGIWVVGTDESGDLLYDEVDYRGPTALVIGGEAEGIRRLVLEGCDQVVRIPMEGQIASLNAAAAGTVVLYEALRQRRRNVAPADTRTPPPPRAAAVTPQEEDMDEVGVEELAESDADSDMTRANDGEVLPIEPGDENGKPEGRGDRDLARDDDRHDGRDDDDRGAEGEATASTTLADANGDEKSVTEAPKKRAPRAKKATTPRKTTARKKATDERG